MTTRLDEIADNIFRISTLIPDVAPGGFTFNQFLVKDDEPLLFHCGMRGLFPAVSEAVGKVIPLADLRWITFGHVEADECGAMNQWLAAAPHAQVAHGATGCMVSVNDLADRPPRALEDGDILELGAKRMRYRYTPHVPHGWDAGVLFEEATQTLLCGDLLTHTGDVPPLTDKDVVGAAIAADDMFKAEAVTPNSAPTIRALAHLKPKVLALMHGSSYTGDCAAQLSGLADSFEARLRAS